MASIYDLKPAFQRFLHPVVKSLAVHKITANQVTLTAVLISFLSGLLILLFHQHRMVFLIIPFILFVRMALNATDGILAREYNLKSNLGVFLNELGDVLSDAFLYLPFAYVAAISPILIISIVILAIIGEMVGVIAIQIGATRRYDGPMGKSDRAFIFSIISLFIACNIKLTIWMNCLLFIIVILLILTIYNRISHALQEVATNDQ